MNGRPSKKPYLFNGDVVDRGSFSLECIMTLIAWKCYDQNCMYINRGNHEAKQVNMIYGFKGEVEKKLDKFAYEAFSELFCALPLVYLIN